MNTRLNDEAGRIRALQRCEVLDTGDEPRFEAITSMVKDLLQVPICAISLVDEDRLWFKSVSGMPERQASRKLSFCDHTIRTREPLIVGDAVLDARFSASPFVAQPPHIRAYAGAPIQSPDGYNLGALCAVDTQSRNFTPEQILLLERFASVVADQLELRTLAHKDFLTGTLTRRAFTESAERLIQQLERSGESAALLVLDIDHFKRVNDRFGHGLGDRVLKAVSSCCAELLRPIDLLGRLGGEEFAIVLTGVGVSTAMLGAERIRRAVEALEVDRVRVTVSIGLTMSTADPVLDCWLAEADGLLYEAKNGGRNRCVSSACPKERVAA